jgi:hypothetical protein
LGLDLLGLQVLFATLAETVILLAGPVHANLFDVLPTNRVLSINKCRVLKGIIYIYYIMEYE